MSLITLAERRWIPDPLIRFGIRRLLAERLEGERHAAGADLPQAVNDFAERLKASRVTIETQRANEQHYEVPAAFFELVLGQRLKYSSGLWSNGVASLNEAEIAMLALACRRADIHNGMDILELGCGWGSLTLWMAEYYPQSRIVAVSNSSSQREYILAQCAQRQLTNVEVITADVAEFETEQRFDRVVSVEMFEHVRNYQLLLAKIASWMRTDAKLFVHIFCHRELAYSFETDGAKNWMGRTFFTGGIMPSIDLLARFDDHLKAQQSWWIPGTHYAKTCEAWLENLDARHNECLSALRCGNNPASPKLQLQQWRMFFMACAELFAYRAGSEWGVSHHVFAPHH
jgi:cyclopropane-fatty-acyl-phospholipid synthase